MGIFWQKTKHSRVMTRQEFVVRMADENDDSEQRLYKDDEGELPPLKDGKFKGNPEHLAKLNEGVEVWNFWRTENPDIIPDLQGAYLQGANLTGAILVQANLTGAKLGEANLSSADLERANLTGADFFSADLSSANFFNANLTDAYLGFANLTDATFVRANLTGAYFYLAMFEQANVTAVEYNRGLLKGRCHGIRAQSCFGDARFRRDVMDQDILDQIRGNILDNPENFKGKGVSRFLSGFMTGFTKPFAILAGLIAGVIIAMLVLPSGGAAFTKTLVAFDSAALAPYLYITLGGMVFAGLVAGGWGQLVIYNLWGLFDFGRAWSRVVLFAFIAILLFGGAYAYLGDTHVMLLRETNSDIWFYPWFISLMGFATLGVSDVAEPVTGLGAVVMMGNVLSGFVTLGLLLSVLGDKFARRS